ncbi:MAG TPA: 23S rRNA (uracil(1939)-C(5))-methyltransferase RlmD [Gammaproteobacteria bacterium]|jgi:23S rRNA (uracil1939-C5)-methyltransferase|nr:23S rRNA (uracil(1939)-C(5))-methyltransferase RlmD [Gammaproteobacteria bacterium]
MSAKNKRREPAEISIDSLSHDGRGVGRDSNGKVTFVDFALPGERVLYQPLRGRKGVGLGTTIEVLEAAENRINPKCEYFGICGGCSLQHLDSKDQIDAKQEQLISNLEKIGHVQAETVIPPMQRDTWGYRRKARLGVRDVEKKGALLVGFREKNSSFVTQMDHCEVLHPDIAMHIPELAKVLQQVSSRKRIPQVEVAQGDNGVVMVLRHLEPLNDADLVLLSRFAEVAGVALYLQPSNLESIHPLYPPEGLELIYSHQGFNTEMIFKATDFIQVNGSINEALVTQACETLDPKPGETVLDLFCGLGNFTLPLARSGATVVGVEADLGLINRAKLNAERNQLDNISFHVGDLFVENAQHVWTGNAYDKVLLDPPRSGAFEMCKRMNEFAPKRLVYVSCNPATLARDADVLVNTHGYKFTQTGVIDMFPHTAHVESIAVFDA